MDNTDNLISIWKSNETVNKSEQTLNFLNSNKEVMETIVQFENKEKSEKTRQIFSAFTLILLTAILLYGSPITTMTYVGLLLVAIGTAYGIITNRTDNFPDARLLNTKEYLENFRSNTLKRNKMHRLNTFIGSAIAIPGLYLTFRDAFPELGFWWIPIMFISGLIASLSWFKDYNKRSGNVIETLDELIADFK